MGRSLLSFLVVIAASVIMTTASRADDPPKDAKPTRSTDQETQTTRKKPQPPNAKSTSSREKPRTQQKSRPRTSNVTRTRKLRESAVLKFAKKHHPELAELLTGLRQSNNRYYEDALLDLSKDAERLGKLAERDEARYSISLRIWKLDSRIRLEIARLSMSGDEEIRSRLRPLVEQRQSTRIELLELYRTRATERARKLDQQLDSLTSEPDQRITKEVERLRKAIVTKTRKLGSRTANAGKQNTRSAD